MKLLQQIVSGKTVTLLGSAPHADLSACSGELLACANGAALALPTPITADVTFINTAVAASPEAGLATLPHLQKLRTRLLLIIESATTVQQSLAQFAPIIREQECYLTRSERSIFLQDFLQQDLSAEWGGAHVPSTGFVACLLLLADGARHVEMRGFSFHDGHSYLEKVFKRGHIAKDKQVLKFIQEHQLPVQFEASLLQQANA